jgi:hypothetical protein
MKRVYAKHEPYRNGHLGEVVEEMKLTGPPTIRCVLFDNGYYAVEGSHRLAAADLLGLCPKIVVLRKEVGELDEHWRAVAETLPVYEYDHLMVFDFEKFEDEINERASSQHI